MYLTNVYARFYKSFNFDYLRKVDPNVTVRREWESLNGMWYPYVRVSIDRTITTIVGANESGKTHSLTAIEKALTGAGILRGDFCRYSKFFSVQKGEMRWPDFGLEWAGVTDDERKRLTDVCEDLPEDFNSFLVFRTEKRELTLYVPSGREFTQHSVKNPGALEQIFPSVFRLREKVALPESVPIRFLASDEPLSDGIETFSRPERARLMGHVWKNFDSLKARDTLSKNAEMISQGFLSCLSSKNGSLDDEMPLDERLAELELARDLIRNVAGVDREALEELQLALDEGRDALANSIIGKINDDLRAALNFSKLWAQDREFRLLVSPREHDLVFTIRDRTETEYAFKERSSGLRYFLSYYIQHLAHKRSFNGRAILLMDEPDAYLSNQGQQALLRIFDGFANPDDGTPPVQVVYVTHSPFLIDKNHSERIRVLEKGSGDEGTRVVRDVSRNHYEPLRSALGSFVGETTFIGNCNLIVEGAADQILLAGAATDLRKVGASELETLNLNELTIVPAGGASHVPYLVYLARGRDVEKPAVIVLLDSDPEGAAAVKSIRRGGVKKKQLLKPERILQILDLAGECQSAGKTLVETEDLVPMVICVKASQRYLVEIHGADDQQVEGLTSERITAEWADDGVFKAIQRCVATIDSSFHIEKIGFALQVLEVVRSLAEDEGGDASASGALQEFRKNMRALFGRLRQMQRHAVRELDDERVSSRFDRERSVFFLDHPSTAKREHVVVLFEKIHMMLDDSDESDGIKVAIQSLAKKFKIDQDPGESVDDYVDFRHRMEGIKYAARLASQTPAPDRGPSSDREESIVETPSAESSTVHPGATTS